jgi:hypothetical protein
LKRQSVALEKVRRTAVDAVHPRRLAFPQRWWRGAVVAAGAAVDLVNNNQSSPLGLASMEGHAAVICHRAAAGCWCRRTHISQIEQVQR